MIVVSLFTSNVSPLMSDPPPEGKSVYFSKCCTFLLIKGQHVRHLFVIPTQAEITQPKYYLYFTNPSAFLSVVPFYHTASLLCPKTRGDKRRAVGHR